MIDLEDDFPIGNVCRVSTRPLVRMGPCAAVNRDGRPCAAPAKTYVNKRRLCAQHAHMARKEKA